MLSKDINIGNYRGLDMCETRTCGFCIANHVRQELTDGTFGHEFQNPEKGIAWFEPCADSKRYEQARNLALLKASLPKIKLEE